MEIKTCSKCSKDFKPSSLHKKCPECKHEESKILCECGNTMQRKAKLCQECDRQNQSRDQNNGWKGGISRHKKGYKIVRVDYHPRLKNNPGYVFEHILVMEEKLQRFLLPEERIHHKNGVKDDNRIENLELWTSNHPAGQRVEDLVEWAKEILALYDK